ncbi:MAG: hypothetical protein PHR05_08580, partial [Bacteroidales bacterium]|nr:hypothetical protein [Bacteroidales bacterium]
FLPLVKPESCPEVMFYGVLRLVDYSGDMWPGFWKIWDLDSGTYGTRILEDMGPDSTAFGGKIRVNGAANRFLAYL